MEKDKVSVVYTADNEPVEVYLSPLYSNLLVLQFYELDRRADLWSPHSTRFVPLVRNGKAVDFEDIMLQFNLHRKR